MGSSGVWRGTVASALILRHLVDFGATSTSSRRHTGLERRAPDGPEQEDEVPMTPARRIALVRRIVVAGLILTVAGCAPSSTASPTLASPTPVAVPASAAPSAASASPSPAATPSATASPTPEASCADRTLAGMTGAQRIGQVFMIGLEKDALNAAERAAVADFHVGSFAFTTKSRAGIKATRSLTDAVQALATRESTAGVRFFVAANQEGGLIQGVGGAGFDVIPSALDQGA